MTHVTETIIQLLRQDSGDYGRPGRTYVRTKE